MVVSLAEEHIHGCSSMDVWLWGCESHLQGGELRVRGEEPATRAAFSVSHRARFSMSHVCM